MRKILYAHMVTLDGYFEGPDGDLSWSKPDEELHKHFNDLTRSVEVSLYGRKLYESMAAFWPTADAAPEATAVEVEFAQLWRELPKIVFSKTLEDVAWNSTLMPEVDPQEIEHLKQLPGEYMDVGGADLAKTFMQLDLIDEYRVYIHPVVLGAGRTMFSPLDGQIALELVETQTFSSGVVMLRYVRTREPGA